jgi:hypothetical protein
MTNQFQIHPDNAHKVAATIQKANDKLARNGIPDRFTYTLENGSINESVWSDNGMTIRTVENVLVCTLNVPSISYGGWEFVARCEPFGDNGKLITYPVPGIELNGYRPSEYRCDHCGIDRYRKATYLIRNANGEFKQIGSTCLQPFLGIEPTGLWALFFDPSSVSESEASNNGIGGYFPKEYNALDIMRLALAVSDNGKGFASKGSTVYSGVSTVDIVNMCLSTGKVREAGMSHFDSEVFAGNESLAKAIINHAATLNGTKDYEVNLSTIAQSETIGAKQFGLFVSAIGSYNRQMAYEVKQAVKAESTDKGNNLFFGDIKGKVTDHQMTVTFINNDIPTKFGTATLITFLDNEGYAFKWFASGVKRYDIGQSVKVTGTIKAHDTYNGLNQTQLNYCKIA